MRFGIAFNWRMYSTSSACSPHAATCATQGPASARHIAPGPGELQPVGVRAEL